MKGKILCPAGCQNPLSRITKAKGNLKSPRPAGSWRPFKCIFGERKKGRAQRAESPALFALCTEKPRQGKSAAVLEQVSTTVPKSAILRFLPLAGNLLGSAFPKPCLSSSRTAYHSLPRQRESSFIPSLVLSPRNPLRWACAGAP